MLSERFQEEARKALQRGYTLVAIAHRIKGAGLAVSISIVKSYLRDQKVKRAKRPENPNKATQEQLLTGEVSQAARPPREQPDSCMSQQSSHAGCNRDH